MDMLLQKYNLKKILTFGFSLVVVLWFLIWFFGYLTTGKLVVETDNELNIIHVEEANSEVNTTKQPRTQASSLTKRLKPGGYMVYVGNESGLNTVSQSVEIRARGVTKVSLNPSKPVPAEPIYGKDVSSIASDTDNLFFIDKDRMRVAQVSDSSLQYPYSGSYKKVIWSSPGSGVAQSIDNSLHTLGNGERNIPLPFEVSPSGPVMYSIASNGDLYVNNGKDVYRGTVSGDFKKIYTASTANLQFDAMSNGLAIVESTMGEDPTFTLVLTNREGKVISKEEMPARLVKWSPDGKNLAVISSGKIIVYNGAFEKQFSVAAPSSDLIWKDNKSLLYSSSNGINVLNVDTRLSNRLTNTQTGSSINNMALSSDNKYVYFISEYDGNKSLYRAGFDIYKESSFKSLSVFLPDEFGVCYANYLVFRKPIIFVEYPGLTAPENCVQTVRYQIGYYGIDPNLFTYSTSLQH